MHERDINREANWLGGALGIVECFGGAQGMVDPLGQALGKPLLSYSLEFGINGQDTTLDECGNSLSLDMTWV